MNFKFLCIFFITFLAFSLNLEARLLDDMKYLGYSDPFIQEATSLFDKTPTQSEPACSKQDKHDKQVHTPRHPRESCPEYIEAGYVQEQLYELGKVRSLEPWHDVSSKELQIRLEDFWAGLASRTGTKERRLSEHFTNQLKNKMVRALEKAGYEVQKLRLKEVFSEEYPGGLLRALVRVTKPLRPGDEYNQIMSNLEEVKQICVRQATINGNLYLAQLTTFVAENPRNRYHYVKTILRP